MFTLRTVLGEKIRVNTDHFVVVSWTGMGHIVASQDTV